MLYILTGYRVLGIVSLDQLTGARHTHTYLITIYSTCPSQINANSSTILHEKIDTLCMQETEINKNLEHNLLSFPNYQFCDFMGEQSMRAIK